MDDARFQQDPAPVAGQDAAPRARRGRQRALAIGIAFTSILFAAVFVANAQLGGGSSPARPTISVTADAAGAVVIRPKGATEYAARAHPIAGADEQQESSSARFALDSSGSVGTVTRSTSEASLSTGDETASAAAAAERVELFGGRVVIENAGLHAEAAIAKDRAAGKFTLSSSTKVTVNGAPVEATPNKQIVIKGVGTLLLNEQAVVSSAPTGDKQTGPRHRIVGAIAHVRVTAADIPGAPAGTELIIGKVDAGVRRGKVQQIANAPSAPASTSTPAGVGGGSGSNPFVPQAGTPRPGSGSLPRRPASARAGSVASPTSSLQSYVFPILGESTYTNDWGAPRASTGVPHQGTDIFATEGTPVVALADGVLDRVGWNSIGGYRLWVFDEFGNSFYYAHLSAYAPIAQDGARVKAGDVIAFVGHTGDAQYTPPHLHFEIHPNNGQATNPFPFLNAWKKGVAVAIGLSLTDVASRPAGSALLSYSDISPNSGLQGSVLDTVPDRRARPIEDETAPRPTDESLQGAINGPAISRG